MKKSLLQLYQEHHSKVSDKWSLYLTEFDRLFTPYREHKIRLLEIGIQNGGSLEIWSKYFEQGALFVGCDIDPACANLLYDNPSISVVVGDANLEETHRAVANISPTYDIIIDDGSHRSSDIVKSFVRYFGDLEEGGIFVAEDLHCGYWQEFEGGLFYPYSSITFFKSLADAINFEHWGVDKSRADLFAGFAAKYDSAFDEDLLAMVHSVEFINSLCVVRKARSGLNQLGARFTTGEQEVVSLGIRALGATTGLALPQAANFWSTRTIPPAEELVQLLSKLAVRDETISHLQEASVKVAVEKEELSALIRARDGEIRVFLQTEQQLNQRIVELAEEVASGESRLDRLSTRLFDLEALVAIRDTEVANAYGATEKLEQEVNLLQGEVRALRSSTSWKVSAPVRIVGTQTQRVSRVLKVIPHALQHGGGLFPSLQKAAAILKREGILGLRHRLYLLRLRRDAGANTPQIPGVINHEEYSTWAAKHDIVGDVRRTAMQQAIAELHMQPVISVIMPVYDPPLDFLNDAIWSVRNQVWPKWELCIADDASTNGAVRDLLKKHAIEDGRIKVTFRSQNGHISEASNSALALAGGDFVALLDQDDCLHPEALYQLALHIGLEEGADIIYTDEDKLGAEGQRLFPFFKPDWSPHLATSQAFVGHLACYRTALLRTIGGFRTGFDGAQDYDLWLRASLLARKIVHIPRVLYHWRMHMASTSMNASSKSYAHEAGRKAVNSYLKQRYEGVKLTATDNEHLFTYKVQFTIPESTLVSIIIPTRDGLDLLQPCVASILAKSSWKNFEILVLDNGSKDPATLNYLKAIPAEDKRVRVILADMPFNWSRLNNMGARAARGDVFLFLNNDTLVIAPDWLESLVGYAQLPDVGTVGALLFFEDGTIQHSGVVVGMGGWADHVFRTNMAVHTGGGPFVSPMLTRNVLAVTGACTAITRDKFNRLGGFDEEFIICGSDVELGLRAYKAGLYNVICAEARLYHYESKTRTPHVPEGDFKQSEIKYAPYRTEKMDPFYNPNLSLAATSPSLNLPIADA